MPFFTGCNTAGLCSWSWCDVSNLLGADLEMTGSTGNGPTSISHHSGIPKHFNHIMWPALCSAGTKNTTSLRGKVTVMARLEWHGTQICFTQEPQRKSLWEHSEHCMVIYLPFICQFLYFLYRCFVKFGFLWAFQKVSKAQVGNAKRKPTHVSCPSHVTCKNHQKSFELSGWWILGEGDIRWPQKNM